MPNRVRSPVSGASPPAPTSSDLVDRLIAHDPTAFEELVRLHGPRLLAVATRYLQCRSDAEDAVQETFVNVVRFVHTFNRASAFETWLFRIVVNSSLMILRTRRRKPMLTNADAAMSGDAPTSSRRDAACSRGDGLERAEQGRRISFSLRALPPLQRLAVLRRFRDGEGVPAIASTFGVTTSTVRTWLHRARRSLEIRLRDEAE